MNRVRVTVDDLRRAADAEVRRNWSAAQWLRWLDAAAVLRDQTFRNIVLIKLQMPDATWVAGRESWQRSGRRVLGRQSGIRIIAPAGSQRLDLRTSSMQGHGVATVWDVSQTDRPGGRPLSVEAVADATPSGVWGALTQVANDAGYSIVREPLRTDMGVAVTDFGRRRIVVADGVAVSALAHELAHLRMHKPRYGRGAPCVGVSKLEAESVAYVVLSYFGLAVEGLSAGSLAAARTSKQRADRVAQTLGERVTFAARRLIGSTEAYLHGAAESRRRKASLDRPMHPMIGAREGIYSDHAGPAPGI